MPFTEEEIRSWHEEKRKREYRPPSPWLKAFGQLPVCKHCHQPFELGDGKITVHYALCYRCAD